jgi:hypothetical protein
MNSKPLYASFWRAIQRIGLQQKNALIIIHGFSPKVQKIMNLT